jgi:hypothetical protein
MIRNIQSYDSIEIFPKSLVALDIDHTIIKFDNIHKTWWQETSEKYDEETVLQLWTEAIKTATASLIDEKSFIRLLKRLNDTKSELILITARNESLRPYTMKHLKQSNLCIEEVYHSLEKGNTLLNVYQEKYSHLQKIIFVDDHMDNVEDVKTKLEHLNPDCYFLQHEKL